MILRAGLGGLLAALVVGLAGQVVFSAPVWAQAPAAAAASAAGRTAAPSRPSWASLTAQQRTALGPLERDWGTIDARRKSKWLEVAARFPAMPVADQQRVQERMAEWARMSPVERGRARLSYQESKQFSPEQKQARWEAYQALPDGARKALAERSRLPDSSARQPGVAASGPGAMQPKSSAVPRPPASGPLSKQVAPTLVQAKPGATTTLMTTTAAPPAHHRPGQPKIAAKPGQVDGRTLLPQSGPQAAASSPRPP